MGAKELIDTYPKQRHEKGRQVKTAWRLVLLLAIAACASLSCSMVERRGPAAIPATAMEPAAVAAPDTAAEAAEGEALTICSFNIKFLGFYSEKRDDRALAGILAGYDIVVVQELVAPPYDGVFPDGKKYKPGAKAAEFFEAMKAIGFDYVLSPEDTGKSKKNHNNGSATEWWVAFFRPSSVKPEGDVESQFLADDRTAHPDYDRVPYAFAFRTLDNNLDFVLISVHLHPKAGKKHKKRRAHELASIAEWIDANDNGVEKDFIILGDMNIQDAEELADAIPKGFVSLNDECRFTNTNVKTPKPYDHVMFSPAVTTEIDEDFDLEVVNLIGAMKDKWTSSDPYPGDPYVQNEFQKVYSDHHPVVFRMVIPAEDDDKPE